MSEPDIYVVLIAELQTLIEDLTERVKSLENRVDFLDPDEGEE